MQIYWLFACDDSGKVESAGMVRQHLDALWDALTGLIETPVEIKIVFHPKTKGSEKLRSAVESVIHVFREAEIAYHEICLEVDDQ